MSLPRRVKDAGQDAAAPVLQYWVGAVEDSDIRLGVAEQGERARLFFCGGPKSYETSTRWVVVDLAADGGGFELDDGDWQIAGTLGDDALRGKVRIGSGDARSFAARPTSDDTLAGLYEGMADCGRVGLIVTQAERSDEPTGQGACVGTGHPPEQVNPILPIALQNDAIGVEIGGREASVRPAAGPPAK
ncbi:MAG TPA: hypothetical protein VJR89_27205 [Polyangiales bacterium]|nr:hypothetical protein [Polyangiales bacterium]